MDLWKNQFPAFSEYPFEPDVSKFQLVLFRWRDAKTKEYWGVLSLSCIVLDGLREGK